MTGFGTKQTASQTVHTGDFSLQSGVKSGGMEKFLRPALFFMLVSVPLAIWHGSYNFTYIKEIFISLSLIILCFSFAGAKVIKISFQSLIVLLIPAWMAVSFVFSAYKAQAYPVICAGAALSFIFVIMANQAVLTKEIVRRLLLLSFIPPFAAGLIQVFFPAVFADLMAFGSRIPSTLGNPNFFAAYLIVSVPFILMTAFRPGSNKTLVSAAMLLVLFLIYKTGSKAAIGALALEMAVFVIMPVSKGEKIKAVLKKNMVPAVIVVAAIVTVFIMLARNIESAKFRASVWSGTLKLAASNPVTGTGPGSFSFAFPAFRPGEIMKTSYMHSYEVSYPENILLQAASEYGILGLALLVFILWIILKRPDPGKKDFYAAFCGLLAVNMAGVDINYGTSAMLAAVLGGMIINGRQGGVISVNAALKKFLVPAVYAIAVLIIVIQFKMHLSDVYLKRAVDFSENAQWQLAVANYKKALFHNPSNIPAGYFLASAYFDSNPDANAAAAVAQLEEVEKTAPNYVLLHYKKAGILNYQGRLDEAVKEYKKMIELDPYLKPALSELAFIYYKEGDLGSAEFYMKRAAETGNDPGLYNNLGNIYFMQKRVQEAILSYKKAIEINPDKDYYYNLGCVYFTLNDIKNAKENIYKAVELGSKSGEAEEKVENMVRMIKKYENAR